MSDQAYQQFAKIRPVIMSGGAGTRLWPLSRRSKPKQFIEIAGSESLFTQTLNRVHRKFGFRSPRIVGNVDHRFLMAEEVAAAGLEADNIILEPFGRNTAAAIALAAVEAEDDELLLILSSDHRILDVAAFHDAILKAVPAASVGKMCCFGITPDYPETGYGYIEAGDASAFKGVLEVASFKEKPDVDTAEHYIASGAYSWNSGMFLMQVGAIRAEMKQHVPGLFEAVAAAFQAGERDMDFLRVEAERFAQVEDISIDYGVMERTLNAAVVPAAIGWSDLGSYSALHAMADRDADENALVGNVVARDVKNSYLHTNGHLLAVQGVEDLIVVTTDDVVMVTKAEKDQDVKNMVSTLKALGHAEAEQHSIFYRPWGSYRTVASGPQFQVKEIVVYPGKRLSLQLHHHRAEHWVVVEGDARVTRGDDLLRLRANMSVYIPVGTKHRLENIGDTPLKLIEVQSGTYLGEDDIERFDDDFGREGTTSAY